MSQDLEDLQADIQRRSASLDAKPSTFLGEDEVRLFKARLLALNEAEDSFLADRIVASLNYDSRPVRLDSVPQAHKDTFQWAFDSRLSDWLRSENSGTFWISGKPGSGKSTFMKFVARHPQTRKLLGSWASPGDELAIAAHFFWIAGTPIQKSWQGLLQSLLFDVLNKRPSVVSLVSPDRWAAAVAGNWQAAAQPWSVGELGAALRALASADSLKLKMCFFIDGLDEYDSDHAELCSVLRDTARSPHVKLCVSSRPWSVFEESFGGRSEERLDIHKLTRNDIRSFVNGQLQSHPGWSSHGQDAAAVVEQIVAQADGVFIWALFVTQSLRRGLTNGDDAAHLRRRLADLPTDLDQLFTHMLESVDPIDRPKMAGILQAAAHALEPLHVDLYWQVERQFEERDYAYRCPIGAGSFDDVLKQREQASSSINEKTKGLLHLVGHRVEFVHRTVKDFILTRDMGEYLRRQLPADYDGFLAISTAYLGFLKTTRQNGSLVAGIVRLGCGRNSGPFIPHLNQALVYASEALKSGQSTSGHYHPQAEELLDNYETAISKMVRTGHVTMAGCGAKGCDPRVPFREELLRHELTPYIARKLREQADFLDMLGEPPLFAALTPMSRSSGESPAPVTGILGMLLERGDDPNAAPRLPPGDVPADAGSPWVLYARGTMSVFNMLSGPCMFPALRFNESLDNGIFDLLLSHGADPNKPLLDRKGAHTVFSHFLDISLSKFLGQECFEGYLRTLDAFLRAGASLDVPPGILAAADQDGADAAFGNLARDRPQEPVLVSYCTQLKALLAMLAADPERAKFVSSVTERLILHCLGRQEYLRDMSSAISAGCPQAVAEPLLALVDSELGKLDGKVAATRKRRRES